MWRGYRGMTRVIRVEVIRVFSTVRLVGGRFGVRVFSGKETRHHSRRVIMSARRRSTSRHDRLTIEGGSAPGEA